MTSGTETRIRSLDRLLDSTRPFDGMSEELFAVVGALDSSATLRRAVTDPGTPEGARKALVHGLFDGKVAPEVADLVAEAATQRWAGGRTFAVALERQGVRAELITADQAGTLEETEDELFRFGRLVDSNPALRNALSDRAVPVAGRQELVRSLLEGKATASTVRLAQRAVVARERTFQHTIESYVTMAAEQKQRVVATVRVAQPLTDEQRDRLRSALARQVGREVAVQEIVEPGLLGGVRVELGDEVIEGTVAGRLEDVRRRFG